MKYELFRVPKISCGHCLATIQRNLLDLEGIKRVDGDPKSKSVTVQWETPATEAGIREKLSEIGYPAE